MPNRSDMCNRSFFQQLKLAILFSYSLVFCLHVSAQKNVQIEKKVAALVSKMTIEEKIGQMAQITLDVLGVDKQQGPFILDDAKVSNALVEYKLGSVLNTCDNKAMSTERWNSIVRQLQGVAGKTRLGIPLIYGFDAIHGATYVSGATFFPQPIAQAATWNRTLVREAASITAYESKAAGVAWNFSPVLDLGVNPCWPRIWETFGEDPYLTAQMGVQVIEGYQNPVGGKNKILACLKHYVGYSDPKNGKDRTNAWISENYLREYHLPSFQAGIRAGARSVMVNSAMINGLPTHVNKYLLTDVLKNELGFTGFVVTDWQDIENVFKRDKLVASNKEALMLAINAGIDMAMIPYEYKTFVDDLLALVKENKVPASRIDDAVRRILRVKYEAGLFETPVTLSSDYPSFGSENFTKTAYNVASESITLLKNNNGILPLPKGSRVLVTGPNADNMRSLNGGWSYSWQGEKTDLFAGRYNTILEALRNKMGDNNVSYVPGVLFRMQEKYYEDSIVDFTAVKSAAQNVDFILLCLGENSYTEKPGDLNDLSLSANQKALAEVALQSGKPVILILNEGRPRVISPIEPAMNAIVNIYLPGNYGGDALADILTGAINPSGKLPFTYPRYVNALTNYIHKPSDEQSNPQGAYDYSADYNPLYEFGSGLSYTTFEYSGLKLDKSNYMANDSLHVTVNVRNTGTRSGKEVVMVFVSDLVASLSPDVKRLRAFEKIELGVMEQKEVAFSIAVKDLAFVDTNNKWKLEKGRYSIAVQKMKVEFELLNDLIW